MTFDEFKIKCKEVIYNQETIVDGEDLTPENIQCVENFEDWFERYYDKGLTPVEAVEMFNNEYEN